MIIRLINFLTGFVVFSVEGSFCDLFFKDCKWQGIPLFNIKFKDGKYICRTFISDYRKLRRIRRKSRVKIRIEKKHGLRFFVFRHRYRIGIPIGILMAVFFLIFASNRIWCIDIVGCENLSHEQVYAALEQLDICVGIKKKNINTYNLSHYLVLQMPEISWSAFNINGSVLTVEIDERTFAPNTLDNKNPCNIIADFDGIIESIEVLKGDSQTVVGSAVKKGDLLVSGTKELSNGVTAFSHSQAKILARTNETLTFEVPLSQVKTVRTGNTKTLSILGIYGNDIPLYLMLPSFKEYQKETVEKNLVSQGRILPLSMTYVTFYETEQRSITYSIEEATDMLKEMIKNAEKTEFSDAEIIEKEETISQNDDTLSITVKYVLKKSIGKEQEITVSP